MGKGTFKPSKRSGKGNIGRHLKMTLGDIITNFKKYRGCRFEEDKPNPIRRIK